MVFFVLVLGIILLGAGVWIVGGTFRCRTEIKGTYVQCNDCYGGKGQTRYAPVFEYQFQGQKYRQQTFQSFSGKYIAKNLCFGEEYCIFVNEKNPKKFVLIRKIRAIDCLIMIIGIIFILFSFVGLGC